ncbi:MAG: tRNA pseudouridine(55) synthase TruB [Candidatus Aminicenantales bacterium]
MDGLILVNKPSDITSHDVVLELRKILPGQKIGHFGTLDPLATGLLPVAVGKATKLFRFFLKMDKVYKGRIRLGWSTDTYDCTGQATSPESPQYPELTDIQNAMKRFEGELSQLPPLFSAKKYKGKPLYKLARRNEPIIPRSSRVVVHAFVLKKYQPPFLDIEVKCSSGTYIRSLAHDLGQILGCGAHLDALVRTEIGNLQLRQSLSLEKIRKLHEQGRIHEFLTPLESLLSHWPKVILKDSGSSLAQNGNPVSMEHIFKILPPELTGTMPAQGKELAFRLFTQEGKLLGLAKRDPQPDSFRPFLIFAR